MKPKSCLDETYHFLFLFQDFYNLAHDVEPSSASADISEFAKSKQAAGSKYKDKTEAFVGTEDDRQDPKALPADTERDYDYDMYDTGKCNMTTMCTKNNPANQWKVDTGASCEVRLKTFLKPALCHQIRMFKQSGSKMSHFHHQRSTATAHTYRDSLFLMT